jgi:hypothetical protein
MFRLTWVELENDALDQRREVLVVCPAYIHMPSMCLVLLQKTKTTCSIRGVRSSLLAPRMYTWGPVQ